MEAYTCDEPHRQRALLTQALQLARRVGDLDLELVALSDLGLALVIQGEVPDGLPLLDEAMAGTLGGEVPTARHRRLGELQHAVRLQSGR